MIRTIERIGNFTSSGIVALMSTGKQQLGFGVGAITYITETNIERLLGRGIDNETNSKPTSWGNLLEPRVFDNLPTDYTYTSKVSAVHPEIDYWAGSADGIRENIDKALRAVFDIKCPFTLKSYVQLVLPMFLGMDGFEAMDAIRNGFEHEGINYPAHKDGDKYYWQLLSNACIHGLDYAELIVYMPYQSELLEIKKMADGNLSVYWMNFAEDESIPYLIDGGNFLNKYIIRFKIPAIDKQLLTDNVLKGGKLLIPRTQMKIAA